MQRFRLIALTLSFFAALILGACNSHPIDPRVHMAIEGTWQGDTTGALLTIYSDGRIVLEGAAGLEAGTVIRGTMERGFDEVLITYSTPSTVCGSATGLYRLSRKDNQLTMEAVREDCPSREQHLDKVWTLKSAIPATRYK